MSAAEKERQEKTEGFEIEKFQRSSGLIGRQQRANRQGPHDPSFDQEIITLLPDDLNIHQRIVIGCFQLHPRYFLQSSPAMAALPSVRTYNIVMLIGSR